MEGLSIGFLTSFFVYYLTVLHKNYNERKKRRFELHDIIKEFAQSFEATEMELGKLQMAKVSDYKENFNNTICKNLKDNLCKLLQQASMYRDLLDDQECEKLDEIRRLVGGIEEGSEYMSDIEAKMQLDSLVELRRNITCLECSIGKLINRNVKHIKTS